MTDTPSKQYIIKAPARWSSLLYFAICLVVHFGYYTLVDYGIEDYVGEAFKPLLLPITIMVIVFIASHITERIAFRYIRISFDEDALYVEHMARDRKTVLDFNIHRYAGIHEFSDFSFGTAQRFKIIFRDIEDFVIHGRKNKKTSGDLAALIRDFKALLKVTNGKAKTIKYSDFYQSRDGKGALIIAIAIVLLGTAWVLAQFIIFAASSLTPGSFLLVLLIIFSATYIWGHIEKARGSK